MASAALNAFYLSLKAFKALPKSTQKTAVRTAGHAVVEIGAYKALTLNSLTPLRPITEPYIDRARESGHDKIRGGAIDFLAD